MPVHGARVLSQEAANQMWKMLRYVVTNGTGTAAQIPGVEVGGKTGTTSSNKDVWFMGATKQLVTGVWMGYDRPRELYGSAGGRWCAPAWRNFTVQALNVWRRRDRIESMVEDARATGQQRLLAAQYKKIVRVRVCNESGLLANENCPSTRIIELSAAEGVPTEQCTIPSHQARASAVRPLGAGATGGENSLGNSAASTEEGSAGMDSVPTARDESSRESTVETDRTAREPLPEEAAPPQTSGRGKRQAGREPRARDEDADAPDAQGDDGGVRILNDDGSTSPAGE
jgi:membrane peptidoglycan carboxypeptidase